jgi:hypothetical protein
LEFLPLHGWLQISMSCSREEGLVGKIDQPRGFGEIRREFCEVSKQKNQHLQPILNVAVPEGNAFTMNRFPRTARTKFTIVRSHVYLKRSAEGWSFWSSFFFSKGTRVTKVLEERQRNVLYSQKPVEPNQKEISFKYVEICKKTKFEIRRKRYVVYTFSSIKFSSKTSLLRALLAHQPAVGLFHCRKRRKDVEKSKTKEA